MKDSTHLTGKVRDYKKFCKAYTTIDFQLYRMKNGVKTTHK